MLIEEILFFQNQYPFFVANTYNGDQETYGWNIMKFYQGFGEIYYQVLFNSNSVTDYYMCIMNNHLQL